MLSQQQNKQQQGGMIEADWGEVGMQLAVSSAHPALKTVKHQHSSWFLYTQDRKEGESLRACQREWDELLLLLSPLFFCTQSTWRL